MEREGGHSTGTRTGPSLATGPGLDTGPSLGTGPVGRPGVGTGASGTTGTGTGARASAARAGEAGPVRGGGALPSGPTAPNRRGRRMPRAVRERHMLDAAVRVFGRQGYRAAAMDDIAELAGVPQPLVHLYLRSKEDLFVACVRREAGALLAAVRGGVRAGDPAERQLRDGLHAFFQHTVRHPEGWAVLHLHARAQGESSADQVVALRTELVGLVTRLIVSAARDAGGASALGRREAVGLAQALVGAAESLAVWAGGDPSVTAREAVSTLMDLTWPGLAPHLSPIPPSPPAPHP
ncbi:TetR/AcrR family transcriptional regulator [Streptomyces uncialis]|uniref:TetR/AcrR family transcriptional regulator n=1 Tax=Streptomyces uncialis TaxID=1048205 RepID=UPI003870C202